MLFFMRHEIEVLSRIKEFDRKIQVLEEKRLQELAKPYNERDYRLLKFISKEHLLYTFSKTQLEWTLANPI